MRLDRTLANAHPGAMGRLLHKSIRLGEGRRATILERPARLLDGDALARFTTDLRTVAGAAVPGGDLDYGVLDPASGALDRSVVTLIHDRDGRPVAFNALALIDLSDERVLHLGLVMIDPRVRSGGLSWALYGLTCFLLFAREGFRPITVTSVSQVPAVIGMVARTFSDVFPDPSREGRAGLRQRLVARALVRDHAHVFGVDGRARLDEDRFVLEDAYHGGSDALKKRFEDAQGHREQVFNDWARRELDYDRGDDAVQVGRIDAGAARTFLLRQVPRSSALSVLLVAGFAALERFVLPLVHWFDVRRPFGVLRPR